MSKSVLKKKVYEISDFKAATRLERLHIHLMQPYDFVLNNEDHEYLEILRECFTIMGNSISKQETIRKMQDREPFRQNREIYTIINDTQQLFGNIVKSNKQFDKMVVSEKLIKLAQQAEEFMDIETARKCWETYIKLNRLDQKDELQLDDIQIPDFVFTNDPSALPGVEDAEVEEE